MALSSFVCLGRRTVTQMITTGCRQFQDWSADYRMFEKQRCDLDGVFRVARQEAEKRTGKEQPFAVSMDDTVIAKTGRKIAGAKWNRDSMSPRFHTNLRWGQRFLQLSALVPEGSAPCGARAIPIDFVHCPIPRKPSKKARKDVWEEYEKQRKKSILSSRGVEALTALRRAMDEDDKRSHRQLIVAADGSYTNKTVIKGLPERTTLIGRFRKDAVIYLPPQQSPHRGKGRPRVYGTPLPTPEQIRKDDSYEWKTVRVHAAGKVHCFDVKTIPCIRWRATGAKDLRLVIIRPLAYRPRKGERLLYREPAYLICTDPHLPLHTLLQIYIWRWEIEVNFRDEKTVLGVGEAQVREENAARDVPRFQVATYALALLSIDACGKTADGTLPLPEWRRSKPPTRVSTQKAINLFRYELWGQSLEEINFSHFVDHINAETKSEKIPFSRVNPLFYVSK